MVDILKGSRQVECAHCKGTGQITLPPELETVEAYHFGYERQAGHVWQSSNQYTRRWDIEKKLPESVACIDGVLQPGCVRDKPHERTRPEVVGEAALHHLDGWTVLAWWDRSGDGRGACNSNLVARGTYDFTTMLEIGKARFPHVMARQTVPIVLVEE
jgi:hypothetical protein